MLNPRRREVMSVDVKEDVIKKEEFEIVYQDKYNYWDQLRILLRNQGWTTQDHATLELLAEMPNSHTVFAVRKSDNIVLGGFNMVDTPNFVYGNCYVIRPELRSAGLGVQMMKKMFSFMDKSMRTKGMVGRAVKPMWKAYLYRPMNAKYLYDMYYATFEGVQELKEFFPVTENHNYRIVTMKYVLKNPEMLKSVIDYDTFVTGQNRSDFIKKYYSIDYVEGVVMFDINETVKGMAGTVPTGSIDGQFKLNPIYASSKEDAGILAISVAANTNHLKPSFLVHVRNNSAGDWILDKCKGTKRKLTIVGATVCISHFPLYKDLSKPEYIFAPTNSPAHFDG